MLLEFIILLERYGYSKADIMAILNKIESKMEAVC